MRLPLTFELDSRDGTSNKDARVTNMLFEDDEGVKLATLRPGLETAVAASGVGNGLFNLHDALISVFGTTLGAGVGPTTVGTVISGHYDFAQSPL